MSAADRGADGYRREPMGGPRVRSDVVDVYVFRREASGPHRVVFLQVLRARPPLEGTWQPIMGHCEAGETATACALRELKEEVGLDPREALGVWALEQTHPFFIAEIDCVVLSPRFAVEAAPTWEPTLNDESRQFRWVGAGNVDACFLWPGQRAACAEALRDLVPPDSPSRDRLRVRAR